MHSNTHIHTNTDCAGSYTSNPWRHLAHELTLAYVCAKHLHAQIQAWADEKARIQTHPRESHAKWTPQPSKVLTSIRHAYTVWLPTDRESHLSARAVLNNSKVKENHVMHVCMNSKQASLLGFVSIFPTRVLYCKFWNNLLWIQDSFFFSWL